MKVAVIIEGLILLILFQIFGGQYLVVLLQKIFPQQPFIFLSILSSSPLSMFFTSVYMLIRCRVLPKIFLNKKVLEASLVGMFLVWIIVFIESIIFAKSSILMKKVFELPSFQLYMSIFLINVWTPIFEEIIFRGYFFEILLKKYNQLFSIFGASFLFVIPHIFMYILWGNIYWCNIIFLFLGGLILSGIYIEGGLIASILTHIFYNSYVTFIYF